jgi:hypothetical protein
VKWKRRLRERIEEDRQLRRTKKKSKSRWSNLSFLLMHIGLVPGYIFRKLWSFSVWNYFSVFFSWRDSGKLCDCLKLL